MPILNYTTSIDAWKTVSEIQQMLAKNKATHINIRNEGSFPVGISFTIDYFDSPLNFVLPCNYKGVFNALKRDKDVPTKLKTESQALKVGWRIQKEWVSAQLAIVEAELASMTEVFMPYWLNPATGKTLYQTFEENGMKLLN